MKKIALCFLSYGNLSKAKFWNKLLRDNSDKFTIYIHNKYDFSCKYFSQYCLKKKINTKWGHSSLVKATLILFKEAYKNADNEYFLFLSGTCLPLFPLDYIYNEIFKENTNLINLFEKNNLERYDHSMLDKNFLDRKSFKKQYAQGMCLTRETVKFFLRKDYIYKFGVNFPILDEHYFISIIKKNNIPFKNRIVSFSNFNKDNKTHPKTYKNLNMFSINHKREKGALFVRKIHCTCQNVNLILNISV